MKNVTPDSEGEEAAQTAPGVNPVLNAGVPRGWRQLEPDQRAHLIRMLGFVGLLVLLFLQPLVSLMRHAAGTDLHSHILLVPFISAYLIHLRWPNLPRDYEASGGWAIGALVVGVGVWMVRWSLRGSASLSENDALALMALCFVLFLAAGGFLFLGRRWMVAAAFPVAFLVFLAPMPDGMADRLETASKLASAEAADLFFNLTGTPVLRDGTVFKLPGIVIEVAQECSGIRSSWVLFITSLLASHLFLRSPWRRIVLVAFVIPLGILRNGFRILVIGWLCVHVGPEMIHSAIHHRGGPVFFALSLIPLFLLLLWLRRGDSGTAAGKNLEAS
jgi:exosortase C (VPDSG-CTERM-specific)